MLFKKDRQPQMCCAMKYQFFGAALLLATCCIIVESFPRKQSSTCENYGCVNDQECFKEGKCNCRCPNTPVSRPSCDVIRCTPGYICRDGACVEDKCANVRCRSGYTCQDGNCINKCATILCLKGTECVDGECKPQLLTQQSPPSCDNVDCPDNQKCFLEEVTCVKAPCYPVPTCKPINGES